MSNFAPWFPAIPEWWKGIESPYGLPVPLAYGVAWVSPIQIFSGPQFSKWQGTAPADANLSYSMRVMKFVTNEATGDVDSSGYEFVGAQSAVLLLCERATAILDVLKSGVSISEAGAGSTTQGFINALCAFNLPPADEYYYANKLPRDTYGGYFHPGTGTGTAHERLYPPSTHLTAPTTYDDVCHIAFSTLGIGQYASRPSLKFKVQALLAESATVGAHPADVLADLWARSGRDPDLLDVETYFRDYVDSGGGSGSTQWRVNRTIDSQTSAKELIQALIDETFCTAITNEQNVVVIVPRDVGSTTAVTLTADDFVHDKDSDPVTVEMKQAADCYNCFPVKYQVTTATGSHTVTNEDTRFAVAHPYSATETIRRAPAIDAKWISTAEHALNLSALLARESFTVQATYKFKLHKRWVLLQEHDILAINEPHLGLTDKHVRIVKLSEDSDGVISIEAVEWFGQIEYDTPAVDPLDGFGTTTPGILPGTVPPTSNVTYYQADPPTGPGLNVGDLWVETDAGNILWVWDGSAWQPAGADGQIGPPGPPGIEGPPGPTGPPGDNGADAKVLTLSATSQVFQIAKSGTISPSSITFTAKLGGALAGSPVFTVTAGTATLTGSGLTRSIASTGMSSNLITVQAALTDGGTTYSDTITVIKVNEGADTLNGILTNEAHTLQAASNGTVTDFTGAYTDFVIYKGAADDTSSWTFSKVDTNVASALSGTLGNRCTVSAISANNGYVDITATHKTTGGLTLTKRFSLTKSIAGQTGATGANGADAKFVYLTSSSQVFQITKAGANSPASITFTATLGGTLAGTAVFTVTSGTATLTGSGLTRTLTYANMATDLVSVTVSVTDGGTTYTDVVSVVKVREGADGSTGPAAVTAFLTNEAHTIQAATDGTVASYVGAATDIVIFVGATNDSANWTATKADGFGITSTLTGRTVQITGMTANQSYVDITASRVGYSSVTKRFTVTKSLAGATGSTGATGAAGSDALSSHLTSEAVVIACDPTGTPLAGTLPVTSTMVVTKGTTVEVGWTFSGTVSPGAAASFSVGASSGTITVTAFPAGNANAEITVTATKAGSATLTRKFTLSKSLTGATGATGLTGGTGPTGLRGSRQFYAVTPNAYWTDAVAEAAVAATTTYKVIGDTVCEYKTTDPTFAETRFWDSTQWVRVDAVVNGNLLVKGTVGADALAAGSVTTQKLVVTTTGMALNADPHCVDANAWTLGGASIVSLTDGKVGNSAIRAGTGGIHVFSNQFSAAAGKVYRAHAWVKGTTANGTFILRIYWLNYTGGQISYSDIAQATPPSVWTEYAGTATAPPNTVYAKVVVIPNYAATTGYVDCQDVRCEEAIAKGLILADAFETTDYAANVVNRDTASEYTQVGTRIKVAADGVPGIITGPSGIKIGSRLLSENWISSCTIGTGRFFLQSAANGGAIGANIHNRILSTTASRQLAGYTVMGVAGRYVIRVGYTFTGHTDLVPTVTVLGTTSAGLLLEPYTWTANSIDLVVKAAGSGAYVDPSTYDIAWAMSVAFIAPTSAQW